jgi:Zn-dependent peptidase ImmA (M78 family)/transcriptional regulator with XRE-family HTH domain
MSVNGDRIRQAREIRGYTQQELAERIGVTQPTIAYLERTLSQQLFDPSDETLQAVALQTGFPLQFFRQDSGPDFPLGSLLYRKRNALTSQEKKRLHQSARLIYEIAEKMAEHLNMVPVRIPKIEKEEPVKAARIARSALGLSPDSPVRNVVHQLEKNGVFVFAVPYKIDEHDAFSLWADTETSADISRRPIIVISIGKPGDRQRWTIAHEFGHLVMHHSFPKGLKQVEDEANQFANEFLMPSEVMLQEITRPVTLNSLAELKPRWGVSIRALIMRATDLEIISAKQARTLHQQIMKLKLHKKEPSGIEIPAEMPRAFKKMAEVLHNIPIDYGKVASYANAPISLVREVMNAHADRNGLGAEITSCRNNVIQAQNHFS